jgi:hypothetical protein
LEGIEDSGGYCKAGGEGVEKDAMGKKGVGEEL